MTQILKSLEEITTGYSYFEKDQVLTATQLNSVSGYSEDQTRLTRTKLLGVGLICGLEVSYSGSQVTISAGMGVTTDGDLLYFSSDVQFTQFKLYDDKNPVYAPFYRDGVMIPLYELIPKDAGDKRSFPLEQFSAKSDLKLEQMVALLFMESYIFDPDQCAGTDCNNAGQKMTNNQRVLLVSKEYIGLLKSLVQTPHQAYGQMEEIVTDRPVINSNVKAHAQLVSIYRSVCSQIQGKITTQLPKIYPACSSFLKEVLGADPAATWLTILKNWNDYYTANEIGIQYYYDFLRDVAETYNEFHELLFDDSTWCSPDKDAFPKHLILGSLNGVAENDDDRTAFYPSHLTSHTLEKRRHAQFLAIKLNTQLETFLVPSITRRIGMNVSVNLLENIKSIEMVKPVNLWRITQNQAIRVTPGRSEEYTQEERAIPYYYKIDASHPIYEYWNFCLHKRGKSNRNYSYNASGYGAQGGAAAPLNTQLGKFDFFRIEGFLGQNIVAVHKYLEDQISTNNLPINLRSVMLGEDRTKIIIKPPFYFGHLHQLHNLMRQDVVNQLDEVKQFSTGLKSRVLGNLTILDPVDKGTFAQVAESRNSELSTVVERATAKLKLPYQDYTVQNSATDNWQTQLGEAMKQSGTFKSEISVAAKTEFNTPFDSLVSNRNVNMLDHLDILIKRDIEIKETRLLFNNYIASHPGLEHAGGVMRGGTFVLVYDENNTIIADFMLPYQETDAEKNDQLEPDIAIKPFRPNYVIDSGLNILEPVDIKIKGRLDDFKTKDLDGLLDVKTKNIQNLLDGDWNKRFDTQQKDYFNTIKESFGSISNAIIKNISTNPVAVKVGADITDLNLRKAVDEIATARGLVDSYKAKAEQATDAAIKTNYLDMASKMEVVLADTLTETTKIVAASGAELSVGTDGFKAMTEISASLGTIKDAAVLTSTLDTMKTMTATGSTSLNTFVKNISLR
ncbi:MAG: hypothetical protein M0Q53_17220 [Prolixibacteraceae bacterium]|jgi:hypothetical protein|nr:hypothetical protein [Prolixibacteraceae bacterium]